MIADAIKQAQIAHRRVIEQTYTGLFFVTQQENVKDPESRLSKKQEIRVYAYSRFSTGAPVMIMPSNFLFLISSK